MIINDKSIYDRSQKILEELLGSGATFRDGQYEAIEATMMKKRTLVVQRTGWGKSLVYFAATRLLRESGKGVTMVVSPLLVLMKNQVEAAARLGLKCDVLNKTSIERHSEIIEKMKNNELDLVLVTPETLFKGELQAQISNIQIGLFVIDEAHCISDWGHDFRLEYGRLREIVKGISSDVPILATTATANDRVIADLEAQLGGNVFVCRGPLTRESLSIQVINMPSRALRYAWILENVPRLDGSGIIYCLTKRDCEYLADFLNKNGISAMPYYSEQGMEEKMEEAQEKFEKNEIKVIVATIKLGMGYDKGDISFVIHYQMPSSIVSYYQQIGRAGRSIENASVFLLYGKEDMTIVNYFIDTIFPSEEDVNSVLELICGSEGGMRARTLESRLNISKKRIERTLEFLENEGVIEQKRHAYHKTDKELFYDGERYGEIANQRRAEARQMQQLLTHKGCYSKYIVECIDDHTATECGRCAICRGCEILPSEVSLESKEIASSYINRLVLTIPPRKMWLSLEDVRSKIEHVNGEGICMSQYGEVGYGRLVKDAIEGGAQISEELIGRSVELLRNMVMEKGINLVTYVPSRRGFLVKELAERISARLRLPLVPLLEKKPAPRQAEMENGAHKCANAYNSFELTDNFNEIIDTSVPQIALLIDDYVDSRWTLTACGYRLMQGGISEVYPFALAAKNGDQ